MKRQIIYYVLLFLSGGIASLLAHFQGSKIVTAVRRALVKKPLPPKGKAMLNFVLIDETKGASTSNGETLDAVKMQDLVEALDLYTNGHYSSVNGGTFTVRSSDGKDLKKGDNVVHIGDVLPDAPDAIAYHDVDGNGVAVAFDGITLSDTIFGEGDSLLNALSHELAEAARNPSVNRWADCLNGRQVALESCDACETQCFPMTLSNGKKVYVSNFLLDAFFSPNDSSGPYDYMTFRGWHTAGPKAPFDTVPSGGGNYQIEEHAGSGETQVMAKHKNVLRVGTPRNPARKNHWSSRSSRIVAAREGRK